MGVVQSEWLAPSPLNRLTDDDDGEWSDGIRRSSSLHRLLHHSTSLTSLSRQTLFCLLPITHTHTRLTALCRDYPGEPVQKGKTNLHFTEARDSEWQWYQLGHMQVCTSLQTDNHASTPPLSFFYRPGALPAAQPTASKH